jgi:two-component system, OmpR family, KDP operon response regulator KdpE
MSAKKPTILVADDDPQLLRLIGRNLAFEGYDVLTASDGELALEEIKQHVPDLVLLDVMMPRIDGFTVCQRVREFSAVPIIIVTARGQEEDRVHGFDLGADDYLTKPFNIEELLARVRAVLRRAQFGPHDHAFVSRTAIGDLVIDYAQHLVTMAGRELPLTPIEYRILAYLAQNAGRIVLQEDLLEEVWGAAYTGEGHLLQVNISRLRHKLEPDSTKPGYIVTKLGFGYMLTARPALQAVNDTTERVLHGTKLPLLIVRPQERHTSATSETTKA